MYRFWNNCTLSCIFSINNTMAQKSNYRILVLFSNVYVSIIITNVDLAYLISFKDNDVIVWNRITNENLAYFNSATQMLSNRLQYSKKIWHNEAQTIQSKNVARESSKISWNSLWMNLGFTLLKSNTSQAR